MSTTKFSKTFTALLLFLFAIPNTGVYADNYKTVKSINVFENEIIQFNPEENNQPVNYDGEIVKLGNGRVILKKIQLPKLKKSLKLTATIQVASNGDRWDKSGSCFVIPASSEINMIDIAQGVKNYPEPIEELTENFTGIISQDLYQTPVELMRFMTPFGVGYYSNSDSVALERRKPVYIDEWEPYVEWTQNITDRYDLLTEEVYVGIFIDTWTIEGYKVSFNLNLQETKYKAPKHIKKTVLPLVNTIYYQGQGIPDLFARRPLHCPFSIPKKAKNIQLHYIVTGHGGQSGGDEFVKNENILSIDSQEIYRFTPWRNDCASFRRFNPSTGVWLVEREAAYISKDGAATKKIDEAIASSDLSRSNWCPGSDVEPITIPLKEIKPGKHKLSIDIPNAQSAANGKMNHWLISAYLTWEE